MSRPPWPWRQPNAETEDYPGLYVHDGRVSGSITDGPTRLPLWAFVYEAVVRDWDEVNEGYGPVAITEDQFASFLHDILQQRGEFGRLVLMLADVERGEGHRANKSRPDDRAWWEVPRERKRIADQLRRCLACLGETS